MGTIVRYPFICNKYKRGLEIVIIRPLQCFLGLSADRIVLTTHRGL